MKAPNLFNVSDEVMTRIAAWLEARVTMTAEEREADRPPKELDGNFTCSAQIAVSQLCAEQSLLVIVGVLAISMTSILLFAGLFVGK